MQDKEIWEHLCKELAKSNTVLDLSKKVQNSILFARYNRYGQFSSTILDGYNKAIFLTVYYLFDKQWSWSIYDLPQLLPEEIKEIEKLKDEAREFIKIRHQQVGHSSKAVDTKDHRRLWWVSGDGLEKIETFLKKVSRFLNAYGMRRFNEGYASHYGGPDTSLQCLIEDLEAMAKLKGQ